MSNLCCMGAGAGVDIDVSMDIDANIIFNTART
jgi:hypothetical protein